MLRRGHPLWQAAHRPLFLCAGLCALLAPGVWLWPGGFGADPVRWHVHELLFGMGGAAVGGYLLTALPGWTGAGRVSPQIVRALTLLWLLARISLLWAQALPFGLLLALGLGYFGLLAVVLARPLLAARAWSRLWSVVAVGGLALGNAVWLADLSGLQPARVSALAMALLFATMISFIGGRAVPAFTHNWLLQSAPARRIRDWRALSVLAPGAIVTAGGLALSGQQAAAGVGLLLAGGVQGLRLAGWQTLHTRHYPALFLLHMAWVWLPAGLILLGVSMLRPDVLAQSVALHGLTMGAMGLMILAISGRAAMARSEGRLIAGRGLVLAFALVWLATLVRVLSAFAPQGWPDPIIASAALWMLGWATFLLAWRPALQGDLPFPVFSALRHPLAAGAAQPRAISAGCNHGHDILRAPQSGHRHTTEAQS